MAPHLRLSVLLIPLAGLFAVTACTQAPTVEDLSLHEQEASSSVGSWAAHGVDPQAASIAGRRMPTQPEPGDDAGPSEVVETEPTAPRIIVSDYDEDDGQWPEASGTALCPFEVHTPGFPAVTLDGTTVVYASSEILSASDGDDELVTVRWLDVASESTNEAIVVVDGEDFQTDDHCRRLWRHAKVVAAEINERLDAQRWRTLEPEPGATDSRWWQEPTPDGYFVGC